MSTVRNERRKEMVPLLAQAFASLGYRRATTAELARRCSVRENILYRLWPDKKAMFIDAIEYVYKRAEAEWLDILERPEGNKQGAKLLLDHEARHHGESGLHRIILAGLSELDDREIRAALRGMYRRFHRFVEQQVTSHRAQATARAPDATLSAWAFVALGILTDVGRELQLLGKGDRRRIVTEVGTLLLNGNPT